MSDYIDREAARDLLDMALGDDWEIEYANDRLDDIPAADVAPVGHGKWIVHGYCASCSLCKCERWFQVMLEDYSLVDDMDMHFCPNCGAKMEVGE